MYEATVVKVMIASPGDVSVERQVIRDVLHEWNAVHSEDRGLVLLPVGWDTHASPEMGDRPQALINKQVLSDCDLLVAVFWTRLGSPTGAAASGTVEEIEEHLSAGKQAMLYFSRAPVEEGSVDKSQFASLVQARSAYETRGLIENYDSVSDFRERFRRQLTQTVIRHYPGARASDNGVELSPDRGPSVHRLSAEARELILQASQDKHGTILRFSTLGGLGIQTNGLRLNEMGDPRSEARWDGALRSLQEGGLIEAVGHKNEVFRVTDRGFHVADELRAGIGAQ